MDVCKVKPLSNSEIEKKSENFIRAFRQELLMKPKEFPIMDLLEKGFLRDKYGFEFAIEDLSPGIEGYTDFQNRKLVLSSKTYEGLERGEPRANFTACHEVGHVVLHTGSILTRLEEFGHIVKLDRKLIRPYEDPECQANKFSAAIQMPFNHIKRIISKGGSSDSIQYLFNVSASTASYRYEAVSGMK